PSSNYSIPAPKELPENFTMEYDMLYREFYSFSLFIASTGGKDEISAAYPGHAAAYFNFSLNNIGVRNYKENDFSNENWSNLEILEKAKNRPVRFSLWRQGQRLRLYVDGQKVFDLPKILPSGYTYDDIQLRSENRPEDEIMISNIRIAEGAPDMRSKLMTDGRMSTTGITFASGSDVINVQSVGVLKSIADI